MTPIDDRISTWLTNLERELASEDAAVRQDAVADAREHLLAARAELPADADDASVHQLLDEYGDPVEVANSYRDAERLLHGERPAVPRSAVAATATSASSTSATPPTAPPAAGWFSVIRDQEAWTSLVYMLLALPLGIASFVFTVVGGALSGSLLILIFGIPLFLAFLAATRGVALFHGRLVEALLGERMPRRTRPVSDEIGTGILERVKYWLRDRRTWTSIVYNLTMLPLGIVYFVAAVVAGSLALMSLFAPLALWATSWNDDISIQWWMWLLTIVLIPGGVLGVFGTLHLARFTGGLHGRYTKEMLVGGEGSSRRRRPVAPATSIGRAAVFLGIAAVLYGAVAIAGHGLTRATTEQRTFTLTESSLDALELDGDTADVDFVSDAALEPGEVEVVATTRVRSDQSEDDNDAVRLDRDGSTATLRGSCGGWTLFMWECDTRIRVHVAPDSELVLRGEVNTGDISLDGGFARVDLHSDTGDIEGQVDAERISLTTNVGDVEVLLGDSAEDVSIETDTGDIEITTSRTWNVTAGSDTGDVEIGVRGDSTANRTMRLSTDTGDIEAGRR